MRAYFSVEHRPTLDLTLTPALPEYREGEGVTRARPAATGGSAHPSRLYSGGSAA
jgi:hypothetical protein